jgi:hypothetical protein
MRKTGRSWYYFLLSAFVFTIASLPKAVAWSLNRMSYHVFAHAWEEQNNELIIVKQIKYNYINNNATMTSVTTVAMFTHLS